MKKYYIIFLINSIIVMNLFHGICLANDLSDSLFSFDKVTIGRTTLDEIQSKYGINPPYSVSPEEEADIEICYCQTESGGKSFIVFQSGIMGSNEIITGFRISVIPPNKKCLPINLNIRPFVTENGVYIGQHKKDFIKVFPFRFKQKNAELYYNTLKQRKATKAELKKLRAIWPDEEQDYFDVSIEIKAKFKDNRLIDYYVHKFESY